MANLAERPNGSGFGVGDIVTVKDRPRLGKYRITDRYFVKESDIGPYWGLDCESLSRPGAEFSSRESDFMGVARG